MSRRWAGGSTPLRYDEASGISEVLCDSGQHLVGERHKGGSATGGSAGGHRQAPHLLGLLLVVRAPDRTLAGVGEFPAQAVQVLALVELPGDAPPARLAGQVAISYVESRPGSDLIPRGVATS
jgi:hypothetical protein